MHLRVAGCEEFEAIRAFYWTLIDKMQNKKDTVGWKKGIYPSDQFLRESLKNKELFVYDGDGGLLACVILNNAWNEGYEGIIWRTDCPREEVLVPHALAVEPDCQGKGIGKTVMQEIIEMARHAGRKTIRLDILKGNTAAERLYTSVGFMYAETRTMFYEDTGWTEFMMYELAL